MPKYPPIESPDPIHRLDRYLVDAGVFGRLGLARQRTLGCVAFHFNDATVNGENPQVHAFQVAKCTDQEFVTVRGVLRKLAEHKALAMVDEPAERQCRGVRRYYLPNLESELGARTFELMESSRAVCIPKTVQPEPILRPSIIMPAIDFPSIASFVEQSSAGYRGTGD